MPQRIRPHAHAPERTMLLLLGSLLTILGCLTPWGVLPSGGTPLRAVDTSIGLLIWGLALLMILVSIIQPRWQRAIMITLSGSAECWLVLWLFQTHAALSYGWWEALIGGAIVFLVALTPAAWWRR